MERAVKACIARVLVGGSRGTGFFVGPSTLLTALHVLADTRGDGFDLTKRRYAARMQLRVGDPDDGGVTTRDEALDDACIEHDVAGDWALVTLATAVVAEPLATGPSSGVADGAAWSAFGFPSDASDKGLVVHGTVIDTGRGQLHCVQAGDGTGLSVGGLSGAPCLARDRAVGIITESLGPLVQGQAINRGGTLFFRALDGVYARHPTRFSRWQAPAPPTAPRRATVPDDRDFDRALRNVLARLFPTAADARRVIADAGLAAERIDLNGSMVSVWFHAIAEARRSQRVVDLVEAARADYGDDPELARLLGLTEGAPGDRTLDALAALLPAQFEVVLHQLGVDAAGATARERVAALLRAVGDARMPALREAVRRVGGVL